MSPKTMVATGKTDSKPGTGRSTTAPPREEGPIIALPGDIPIAQASDLQFGPPSPEDRKTLRTIYFDFDRSTIKSEFQPVLEGIAQWMKDRPNKQLLIEGHCDERGTHEYNLALGERRALSIRRFLVGLGISPDLLHTISYGEEKPADPASSESAWARNRRGEFKVSAD